ncbi:MAG: hypothetical protein ACR2KQ_10420 [Actinomycetota bacterium]
MDENREPQKGSSPSDIVTNVTRELERAAAMDDATRLRTLEELYRSMETELQRDLDQAGPPRH